MYRAHRNLNFHSISLLLLLVAFSCKKQEGPVEDINNSRGIAAVVNNNFTLTFFNAALKGTGYVSLLLEPGPFTTLAPSNNAFINIGYSTGTEIDNALGSLQSTIPYHIYRGRLALDSLPYSFNQELVMENKLPVYISHSQNERDSVVTINGIRIESRKFEASNGIVYTVEKVLQPTVINTTATQISNAANLTFFNAALQHSGLTNLLNTTEKHTVFAPVNGAFIDRGILSTDSIYKMNPQRLRELINAHVTTDRKYVYDYIMKAEIVTNTYNEIMLDKSARKVVLNPDFNRPGRFTGITLINENPESPVSAKILTADITNRNGVLHTIDKILIP